MSRFKSLLVLVLLPEGAIAANVVQDIGLAFENNETAQESFRGMGRWADMSAYPKHRVVALNFEYEEKNHEPNMFSFFSSWCAELILLFSEKTPNMEDRPNPNGLIAKGYSTGFLTREVTENPVLDNFAMPFIVKSDVDDRSFWNAIIAETQFTPAYTDAARFFVNRAIRHSVSDQATLYQNATPYPLDRAS